MAKKKTFNELLEGFDPDVRVVVQDMADDLCIHLVESLPNMVQKTIEAGKQSSMSPTVTVKPSGTDQVELIFTPRVRYPDKSKTHKLRMEEGQLAFGWKEPEEPKQEAAPPEDPRQTKIPGTEKKKTEKAERAEAAQAENLNAVKEENAEVLAMHERGEVTLSDEDLARLREVTGATEGQPTA